MGLIGRIFGRSGAAAELGSAVVGVAEVFVPNATRKMVLGQQAFTASLAQYGAEFQGRREGRFDRFVNGLNRLPRPALAIGTLGLFVYAMVSPEHFSVRMQGLAYVPEPLWWLLGAVVSFYFGAREMYHYRNPTGSTTLPRDGLAGRVDVGAKNPALAEWKARTGR